MSETFRIMTLVKKADAAFPGVFCRLVDNQPLLVSEDTGRAFISDLNAQPVGFISDPTHSSQIIAKIKNGEILMAKCVGKCFCVSRSIHVWSEANEQERQDAADVVNKMKVPPRVPERV